MCVRFCVDRARLIVVTCALLALAAAGCGAAGAGIKGADDDCAIIVTDDDLTDPVVYRLRQWMWAAGEDEGGAP